MGLHTAIYQRTIVIMSVLQNIEPATNDLANALQVSEVNDFSQNEILQLDLLCKKKKWLVSEIHKQKVYLDALKEKGISDLENSNDEIDVEMLKEKLRSVYESYSTKELKATKLALFQTSIDADLQNKDNIAKENMHIKQYFETINELILKIEKHELSSESLKFQNEDLNKLIKENRVISKRNLEQIVISEPSSKEQIKQLKHDINSNSEEVSFYLELLSTLMFASGIDINQDHEISDNLFIND